MDQIFSCANVHNSIYNRKKGKHLKYPSTDEWINKTGWIRDVEYYSAVKRNEALTPAPTWMNLEDIVPGEINQTHRDRHYMIPLI